MADATIADGELFYSETIALRLVRLDDCSEMYLAWLRDPEVNRYLETRWQEQTPETIRAFVAGMRSDPNSYLFAILEPHGTRHVGNIKLGPVNRHHLFADVSYFIGDRAAWGRGYATDAIRSVTRIGFERIGLHRVQAGVYERNLASVRALEKAGFRLEARLRGQLISAEGRQDHLLFAILREEFEAVRK